MGALLDAYAGKANGSLVAADSGQAWDTSQYDILGNPDAPMRIVSGRATHVETEAVGVRALMQAELAANGKRIGGRFVFAAGSNPGQLTFWLGQRTDVAVPHNNIMLAINPAAWAIQVNENNVITTLASGLHALAKDDATSYVCHLVVNGNRIKVRLPDGSVADAGPDPRIAALAAAGRWAIFDVFQTDSSAQAKGKFLEVWADAPATFPGIAGATLKLDQQRFPIGTSVVAHKQSNWHPSKRPPEGAPLGAADDTKLIAADGTLAFVGLTDDEPYFAAAQVSGTWRYSAFTPGQDIDPSQDIAHESEVAANLAAHEADTTLIHGIADTSLLETLSGAQAKVDTHSADTTAVHGITDTSVLAVKNADNAFSASQSITNAGGKSTLALTNTGADTGLTIGGDCNLYRVSADVLRTDDNLYVGTATLLQPSGAVSIGAALDHNGTTLGFYGAALVARPAAYTQTYATTTRTHALSAANEAHAFNVVFSDTEVEAACNALGQRINELKNLVNQVIDDDQLVGLKQ